MASALALAHIEAERRLREATRATVQRIWQSLPGYDRENVDEWLAKVLPVIAGAQRASVALTNTYLARATGALPVRIDPKDVTGEGIRNGADPREVYTRPFVTVWTKLSEGVEWQDAVDAGEARAASMAATDCQLAMRNTLIAVANG